MSVASSSSIRVRYAETDQMGVAWHGNVFAWFEVGRTDDGYVFTQHARVNLYKRLDP